MHDDSRFSERVEDEVKDGGIDTDTTCGSSKHHDADMLDTGIGKETLNVMNLNEINCGNEDGDQTSRKDNHLRPVVYGCLRHDGIEAEETYKACVHYDAGQHC